MKNKILRYICALLGLCLTAALFSGCDSLLDADNPNNLLEEDLSNPSAYNPMVNGSEASVVRALAGIYASYSTATDELVWIGSRDAWGQLMIGRLSDINNEFVNQHFPYVGEARWWADEVIRRGEEFRAEGTLPSETDLARAYLYGAIIYITIADMFDDFVIDSDKTTPGFPVGPEKMSGLYDTAIEYLNTANSLDPDNFNIVSILARAHQSKGIWEKNNPVDSANPMVASTEAARFAQEAINLSAGGENNFILVMTSSTVENNDFPEYLAGQVNDRNEMRISDEYIFPDAEDKRVANIDDGDPATSIRLNDPIDGIPSPALYSIVLDFANQGRYADITASSTREMFLILAEDALANGDTEGFASYINQLRSLDGLTPYSGQLEAIELLKHSRRVNLFLQGRRLADHYRFDDPSVQWQADSEAMTSPGLFFPITIDEIQANPNIN